MTGTLESPVDAFEVAMDRINPTIERAERALALAFAVAASIPLGNGRSLCFGKQGKVWRLSIGGDGETILTSASRKTRCEALRALPDLVTELRSAEMEQLEYVEGSLKIANDCLALLDKHYGVMLR